MIKVVLPAHLRTLAGVEGEVLLPLAGEITPASVIDALEGAYPMLHGTIRDPATRARRPFVRFFVGGRTSPTQPLGALLPSSVGEGAEPFVVLGAIAGG